MALVWQIVNNSPNFPPPNFPLYGKWYWGKVSHFTKYKHSVGKIFILHCFLCKLVIYFQICSYVNFRRSRKLVKATKLFCSKGLSYTVYMIHTQAICLYTRLICMHVCRRTLCCKAGLEFEQYYKYVEKKRGTTNE